MLPAVNETNLNTFLEESHKKPLIIDAYAEWCGPCQQMAPLFEQVAKELEASYTFAKLNVDDNTDVADRYKIRSIPTMLFIKNGSVIATKAGFMNASALKAEIEKAFK